MRLKAMKCGLLAVMVLFGTSAAIGQNSLFLRDSPLASLAGAELDALLDAIGHALDTAELNTPVSWQTMDKRMTSIRTVTEDYQKQNLSCRKMTLESTKGGETYSTRYGFCRVDENWLFDLE